MRSVDVLLVTAWFAASRWLAANEGISHDGIGLQQLWQVLPLDYLASRYFESLWYLHSQPPLYNMFVGFLLHLPGDLGSWIHGCWMGAGLLLVLSVLWALRAAGMPRVAAHVITLAFALNPTLLLYENFVLYAYPEAVCVLLGMVGLLVLGQGRVAGARLAGASACALVGFRAFFQAPWALAWAVAGYWSLESGDRRWNVVRWLAAPALLALALVLKNGVMFDVWTSSSWYGMNLAKLTLTAIGEEAPQLVREGLVSAAFAQGTFLPLDAYPPSLVESDRARMLARHGFRTVLFETRTAAGAANFNHVGYLAVSRQFARDSLAAFRARPQRVEQTIKDGFWLFLRPASNYPLLNSNRPPLEWLERLYLAVVYPANSVALVALGLVLAVVSATWVWVVGLQTRDGLAPAAGYVLVTVVWVVVAGNLAEFGENNRFRFALDPMVFTWNGMIAARVWTWASAGRPRRLSRLLKQSVNGVFRSVAQPSLNARSGASGYSAWQAWSQGSRARVRRRPHQRR